jgi:hypothetical protein
MNEIGNIEEQLSDFEKIIENNILMMHRECLQRIKVRDTIISMREKISYITSNRLC